MNAFLRVLRNFLGLKNHLIPDIVTVGPSGGSNVIQARTVEAVTSMASLATKTAATIKPHVPLIRFRYLKGLMDSRSGSHITTPQHKSIELPHTRSGSSGSRGASTFIDELPPRYRRRQMTQQEMDSINSGGCAPDVIKPVAGKQKPK